MAEIKVSQLPEASQINDEDLLMIVQGGSNKKITKANAKFASGDEVSIGTTEPVEEEKLWINPDEVPSGSLNPITNEYSVATDKGYSCDYLNGSIVETGTNTNGTYIKYGNGVMICTKSVESSVAMTNAWGSYMYEGVQNLGNFPETFISAPQIFVTNASGVGAMLESFNVSPTTTTAGVIFYCRPDAGTRTIKTDIMAIGRWK